MSYYYNYYIGYMKDNKIYPLGPYDSKGDFQCTLWRSRSFASDLHDDFLNIPDECYSDELKEALSWTDECGEKHSQTVKYLPLAELGSSDFVKKGYYLLSDIQTYTNDEDAEEYDDLFYEHLTAEAFAAKLQSEIKYGLPAQQYDCEGNPFEMHPCADYGYFAYPDYHCKEYEIFCIKNVAQSLSDSNLVNYKSDAKIVVLETEG